ncbi:MAG: CBM96 family carbohydrate-binding protein, partial [Candidatus Thorarchaeota archaeon]
MKKTTFFLILILTFSMFSIAVPIASDTTVGIELASNPTTLAATPGADVNVIRVSDDAFTVDTNPDTNYGDHAAGLACGKSGSGDLIRTWLKFNLTHIPKNAQFTRATLNLFITVSWTAPDEPIGVYFSENDTWTEDDITWNNEPEYDPVPLDVIDSPSSPNMFVGVTWYEWEITADVLQTVGEDGMMTLLVRQVNETPSTNTENDFASRETSISGETNTIPNIALEYSYPTAIDLEVDGFSESPQIDYINSANPEFGWTFDDSDPNDFQKNYELEVWNSSSFDETRLMNENHSETTTIHDTAGAGISQPDTFNAPVTFHMQYKWPSSMITQSGVVDKLFFEMNGLTGTTTFNDLAIHMICVDSSSELDYVYETNYDGRTPIQVLNRTSYTANTEDGFMEFDIENAFILHSSMNLIIEIRHTGTSGSSRQGNVTIGGGGSYAGEPDFYSSHTASAKAGATQGLKLELVTNEVYSEGVSTNLIPFGLALGSSGRFQFKYNQSLIEDEGIIDRILFPAGLSGDVTY